MVPSKALIPVDGSPASLRAVDFAIEMATQNPGSSLVLLNVQNISAMALAGAVIANDWQETAASDWQETASQASGEALNEAIGKLEAAGAVFKTLVRSGEPAETIAQVAREEDIQHIVMGTRGLGRIQGLLLGSVAMKVIHLAQVPITLIK
jgi:nucleotide-binding universal stress UspA family protein